MTAVDMRLRPPLKSWVKQLQFTRGDDYYNKLGYERPAAQASIRQRSARGDG